MKLTVESPFLLPTSQVEPEDFWEAHAVDEAASKPSTMEEEAIEAKVKPSK